MLTDNSALLEIPLPKQSPPSYAVYSLLPVNKTLSFVFELSGGNNAPKPLKSRRMKSSHKVKTPLLKNLEILPLKAD